MALVIAFDGNHVGGHRDSDGGKGGAHEQNPRRSAWRRHSANAASQRLQELRA
jgi:hypothetical protein